MGTLVQKVEAAIASKNNIRQAIIRKGVDVPVRTPLRLYSEKIDDIINEYVPEWKVNDAGILTSVIIRDKLVFPTEVNGQAVSTTFGYTGTYESLWGIKSMEWPEYFLTVDFANVFPTQNSARYSQLQEIKCGANVINFHVYMNYISNMRKIHLTNYSGTVGADWLTQYPVSTSLSFICPNAAGDFIANIGTASNLVDLTIDMPKITVIGGTSTNAAHLQYCTGDWTFPSASQLRYHRIPDGEQTLRLPALEQQTYGNGFNLGGGGILHLYIGPNLTRCDCAANWVTNAARIDIHIPAGDTTTKATLDAAGVAYTQDYVI